MTIFIGIIIILIAAECQETSGERKNRSCRGEKEKMLRYLCHTVLLFFLLSIVPNPTMREGLTYVNPFFNFQVFPYKVGTKRGHMFGKKTSTEGGGLKGEK